MFGLARDSLHQEAPQIALQADFVVIDGPPRVAALARSALLAADLVLIPVQPSAYDVWASHEMLQLITEARVFRPQLRAAFVINRRVVGTVIGREARAALADQPFPALLVEVSQRIVFADSVAAGRLAFEVAPHCAAAREIAALAHAVREMLMSNQPSTCSGVPDAAGPVLIQHRPAQQVDSVIATAKASVIPTTH